MPFFGNLGAAAGGASQGMQDVQDIQLNQLRMEQLRRQYAQQQQMQDAQQAAAAARLRTMQDVYGGSGGGMPAPQPPMPGQASVPMTQPAPAMQPTPRGVLPPQQQPQLAPWQAMPTAAGAQPPAGVPVDVTQNVQLPPKPPRQMTMEAIMANVPSDPRAAELYLNEMTPMAKAKNEWSEPYDLNGSIVQRNAQSREIRPVLKGAADKGGWGEPYQLGGAWVQENEKSGQVRRVTGPQGGAGGGAGNLGHLNAFLARETKDLAPITDGQMKSAKIVALLDSGNAVATAQVQQALSDLYSHLRATTQIYADNKSFGNVEQRLANSINRFLSGKYSSEDKKMIKDLVSEMNDKVFTPARSNVIKNYKNQAKTFGYDPGVADIQNPYGGVSEKPAAPMAPPAGFTIME